MGSGKRHWCEGASTILLEDCLFINTVYIFLCEHDWIHSAEQDILDGVMAATGIQLTLLSWSLVSPTRLL